VQTVRPSLTLFPFGQPGGRGANVRRFSTPVSPDFEAFEKPVISIPEVVITDHDEVRRRHFLTDVKLLFFTHCPFFMETVCTILRISYFLLLRVIKSRGKMRKIVPKIIFVELRKKMYKNSQK
jgi:hypothetical protein